MTSPIAFPAQVIGLMSGTSADGVDAAMLYTDGRGIAEPGESLFEPYDDVLRADIFALMDGVGDRKKVEQSITDVHIQAVNALIKKANVSRETISLIGFHGQTIRHAPAEGVTVQIGDAARMARELGIPVVADFRSHDVKHGGQGAPLVPLYHAALAANLPKPLMVVNIGGVSNVTWMGDAANAVENYPSVAQASREAAGVSAQREGWVSLPSTDQLIAFDSGPGNALMDDWVRQHTGQRCDEGGEIAARGIADNEMVRAFLRDPFFLLDAPKSLDRNYFRQFVQGLMGGVIPGLSRDLPMHPEQQASGDPGIRRGDSLSLEDGAATLASMTATAIALSFGAVPAAPRLVLIAGGGRKNAHLMGLLKACVNAPVSAVEEVGWNGDMLEAQAFAYLAARSAQGLPLSLPTTTGVREPVTGGVLFEVRGP